METLIYAVKSVENKEINKIYESWDGEDGCKAIVFGKPAVYSSFTSREEAINFLKNAPVSIDTYGKGYIPSQKGKHIMYGKYKFDRCKERENGFSVRIYETPNGEKFCCVGYGLPSNDKLMYAFTGEFSNNPKFGYEFVVESYVEHITSSKNDIINYLSCGIIKGIGPKRAELIYEKFKGQTLEMLEKTPEKLLSIKGISKKGLKKIVDSYNDSKASREIIYFLLKYGISQKYGMKLFSAYGSRSLACVKENPYILSEIRGLTFLDADRVAKDIGFPLNSEERFFSCAFHVLKNNELSGNTGMETKLFQAEVYKLLEDKHFSKNDVFDHTCRLVKKGVLKVFSLESIDHTVKQYIFTKAMCTTEYNIAENILRIKNDTRKPVALEVVSSLITSMERKYSIYLDEIQRKAVTDAFVYGISVITGGPGSGKTTIIRFISEIYTTLYENNTRVFLAPTGRAARIMTESTKEEAQTAHSFLHIFDGNDLPENDVIINSSLVVVDEFSMVDVFLANSLFHSMAKDNICVLVGDIDQLPSVGPGAVLRDIIESNVIHVTRLAKIYRQGEDTEIYENSKKINEGKTDIKEGRDFHFYETSSMEDIKHMMGELYVKRVKEFGLMNVMCLCPFRDHIAGITDMNVYLQNLVNPYSPHKNEITYHKTVYREGDIVMHTKDNTKAAANGDIGIISFVGKLYDKDGEEIEGDFSIIVEINGTTIEYTKDTVEKLVLAYATTVHKSQGSQADAVITCLSNFHKSMLYRNIPYVAVSRGKKQVDAIGEMDAWKKAILNLDPTKTQRITLTNYYLKLLNSEFVKIA